MRHNPRRLVAASAIGERKTGTGPSWNVRGPTSRIRPRERVRPRPEFRSFQAIRVDSTTNRAETQCPRSRSGPSRPLDSGRLTQPIAVDVPSAARLACAGASLGGRDGEEPSRGEDAADLRRSSGLVSHRRRRRLGGGLEAFTQLLAELPADTGMAFVLIQHLDPTHPSFLADALARATKMAVAQAKDGERVEPEPRLRHPSERRHRHPAGVLTLAVPADRSAQAAPAHRLLPRARSPRSGAARRSAWSSPAPPRTAPKGCGPSSGEDGITFAQDPKSAKFDGMPRSAIDAGVVDYVLPVPELARELLRLSRHPYVAGRPHGAHLPATTASLDEIFVLVRDARRRRLQRVQGSDAPATARAPDGAAADRAPARLPGAASRRTRGSPVVCTRTSSSTSPRSSGIRTSSRA